MKHLVTVLALTGFFGTGLAAQAGPGRKVHAKGSAAASGAAVKKAQAMAKKAIANDKAAKAKEARQGRNSAQGMSRREQQEEIKRRLRQNGRKSHTGLTPMVQGNFNQAKPRLPKCTAAQLRQGQGHQMGRIDGTQQGLATLKSGQEGCRR